MSNLLIRTIKDGILKLSDYKVDIDKDSEIKGNNSFLNCSIIRVDMERKVNNKRRGIS